MKRSTKTYTKGKKMSNRQNPRTNGKSKPIQTKSPKHTDTHSQKEKLEKIYMYEKQRKRATKSINKSNDSKLYILN